MANGKIIATHQLTAASLHDETEEADICPEDHFNE